MKIRGNIPAFGFALLAAAVLLYHLGAFPLEDWDEAIYAEVLREMVRMGDVLTLHYNHEPYFNKPPLYFWVGQAGTRLLGFSEFSSRLPGVVFGAMTLWAVLGLGRALGSRFGGVAGGVFLLTNAMFLENGSRHATPDSLLLFLGVAALWAQWRGRASPGFRLVAALCAGGAVMTKGAAAFPLLLTLLLLHVLRGDSRVWRPADYVGAALLFLALVLPWYLLQTFLHGQAFWRKHFVWSVWRRATDPEAIATTHVRDALYYVRFLLKQLVYLWPAALLYAAAAVAVGAFRQERKAARAGAGAVLTLVTAAVVPMVVFSLSKNKAWWYVLPALPPLCILMGLWFERAALALWERRWGRWVLAVGVAALVFQMTGNVRTTLAGQERSAHAGYGALADLARAAAEDARAHAYQDPALVFPRESPTVAVYTPFPVLVMPDYLERLRSEPDRWAGRTLYVLDRRRRVLQLSESVPLDIIATRSELVLGVARDGTRPRKEKGP